MSAVTTSAFDRVADMLGRTVPLADTDRAINLVRFVPTAIAPKFIPTLPELTIGWGVATKGKDR